MTTTIIDPETAFPQVEKMIYNLAWKTANAYPVSFEEARSEAYFAFMKACQDYNPAKGQKFSSWCYYWVWCKLKDLVMKRSADPLSFVEINEELAGEAPPAKSDYLELIEDLSDDAKEIIALLVDTPAELIGMSMTPRQFLKKVKDHMVAKGRDRKQVDLAHKALAQRFQEVWN